VYEQTRLSFTPIAMIQCKIILGRGRFTLFRRKQQLARTDLVPGKLLLIESLQRFTIIMESDFKVEHPHRSGKNAHIKEIVKTFRIAWCDFTKDEDGKRPVLVIMKNAEDEFFRDHYFYL